MSLLNAFRTLTCLLVTAGVVATDPAARASSSSDKCPLNLLLDDTAGTCVPDCASSLWDTARQTCVTLEDVVEDRIRYRTTQDPFESKLARLTTVWPQHKRISGRGISDKLSKPANHPLGDSKTYQQTPAAQSISEFSRDSAMHYPILSNYPPLNSTQIAFVSRKHKDGSKLNSSDGNPRTRIAKLKHALVDKGFITRRLSFSPDTVENSRTFAELKSGCENCKGRICEYHLDARAYKVSSTISMDGRKTAIKIVGNDGTIIDGAKKKRLFKITNSAELIMKHVTLKDVRNLAV